MNLVPDSKITATQKIVDKRYTISHIFTWALYDFWIVKRLSIGIPLKSQKTTHNLDLNFDQGPNTTTTRRNPKQNNISRSFF